MQSTVGVAIPRGVQGLIRLTARVSIDEPIYTNRLPLLHLMMEGEGINCSDREGVGGGTVIDSSCLITSTPTRRSTRQADLTRSATPAPHLLGRFRQAGAYTRSS